jgi:hypothetical protein
MVDAGNVQSKTTDDNAGLVLFDAALPTNAGAAAQGHEDNVLFAELASVNTAIAQYLMRALDAEAGRREPDSVDVELALINQMHEAAETWRRRVSRRMAADA